jgi:hypothetical protein
MRVVVAVTRPHVPLLVAMVHGAVSIMASVPAIASCDSDGRDYHQNAAGGFDYSHLGYLRGICSGLAREHRMDDGCVDIAREAA